jgi:hypothetical protein
MIKLHSQGIGAGAAPQNLPRELIGSHHGAMGQTGHANGDGSFLSGIQWICAEPMKAAKKSGTDADRPRRSD